MKGLATIRVLYFALALLVFLSCSDDNVVPPSGPKLSDWELMMVDALSKTATEVSTSALTMKDSELKWLDQFGEARILGLGEATHGSKEFFEMKDRIFRYMAENHDYTIFGIEADFAESFYINQYIQGGPGDLKEIMQERMHFWTWNTAEVASLIEWMRHYNLTHLDEPPLLYMGFDCQYMTYQLTLLRSYLLPEAPEIYEVIEHALLPILNADDKDFNGVSGQQVELWHDTLVVLQDFMEFNREFLVAMSDEFSFGMHKHLLRNLAQVMQVKYFGRQKNNATNWRDEYMAENMHWFAELVGPTSKSCAWAHNAHVANSGVYGGSGAMGHHLRRYVGQAYQVVAFGFSRGTFTAFTQKGSSFLGLKSQLISESPKATSANHLFDQLPLAGYAVTLNDLRQDSQWRNYFRDKRLFLEIGSTYNGIPNNYYRPIDIAGNYDLIVYYRETKAAVQN